MNKQGSMIRDSLGRFVGNKYNKINGEWHRSKCIDCGRWCKAYNTIRCQQCRVKIQKKPPNLIHNIPHSQATIAKLKLIHQKEILTYRGIHSWLRREFGAANKCENKLCKGKSSKFTWANISGNYLKDIKNYRQLCASCHISFDRWGHEIRL